jgi:hypothetical protein
MRRLSFVVTVTAVVAMVPAGGGVARAVVAAGPQARAPTVRAPIGDLPVHRCDFVTRGGCLVAGQGGVGHGRWSQFQCANATGSWNLWTDR